MKLYFASFIALFLILTGCSSEEKSETNTDSDKEVETAAKVEEEGPSEDEAPVEPAEEGPTERTEPIADGKYPWEVYEVFGSDDAIQERAQNGEVVFLLSDAEALENELIEFANGNSEKPSEWWHSVVLYYNGTLKGEYPDKTDYFAKMAEIENTLLTKDTGNLSNLINEAAQLRGAK
ncbi:hypothetical protein [Cytobacillus purgationiresistens]|uniref:Uncharacterized protein n=1 Tax=Cytobacillus purgationiresistens TaxID=863449 RepID=A0ABU0AHH8_9BACI|nr:hypothetical protein [Cytobacillus purgationiresistens]MDQ0270714.1 hypothetical protein [Cytobacillus purgationiresistens]